MNDIIANADTDRIQMFETIGVRPVDDLFPDLPPTLINPSEQKLQSHQAFIPNIR